MAAPPIPEVFYLGNPPVPIFVRRSARARRYSLRIANKDGRVVLSLPLRASLDSAKAFAAQNEAWVRRHLLKRPAQIVPALGGEILFNGVDTPIRVGEVAALTFTDGAFVFPYKQNPELVGAALRGHFKAVAQQRMLSYSRHFAELLGCQFRQIRLRDTATRWGSCNSSGDLMYSWRLVMAPPAVQSYVAAHEVAHLIEMNHSAAFWRLVEGVAPDYQFQRGWLREHSGDLHSYVF